MQHPPKFFLRFFRWFCHPSLQNPIEGDLMEFYEERMQEMSKSKADLLFIRDVLLLFRKDIIKPSSGTYKLNTYGMLKNYFKVAWRSMIKQKVYAAIKIGGFAIGIAACILISLYIIDETHFDTHYQDGDRIFRLTNEYASAENDRWTLLGAPIRKILYDQFPEIEKVARVIVWEMRYAGDNQFRRIENKQNFYEKGFIYADPELLDILEIPMVYGESGHALSESNTIVLSKSKADKHFPNENPVGKQITLNDGALDLTIGGVMEDLPANTHLQFDFIISLSGIEFWRGEQTDWCCKNYEYYVKTQPGTDKNTLEKKLLSIRDDHIVPYLESSGSANAQDVKENHFYYLQPIRNAYLRSDNVDDMISRHGVEDVVWILGVIAMFILFLACVNFINLSTAKSAQRSKEVGLRKAIGSYRSNLIFQHLSESILYSFLAVLLGVGFAWILLPTFSDVADKTLVLPFLEWWFFLGILALTLFVGLVAGIYPALYMTSFRPVEALKGQVRQGAKSSLFRSALVVFQFTISLVLIIGAIIVSQQMRFILNKELGYNNEQVIVIEETRPMRSAQRIFKDELVKLADVKNATISSYIPIAGTAQNNQNFWQAGKSKIDRGVESRLWRVDDDYFQTLGLKLAEGRELDAHIASDTSSIIINESMARLLQLKKPIGSKIEGSGRTWQVIGIVEDFHFGSVANPIGPLCMVLSNSGSMVIAKVNTKDMFATLTQISEVWDKLMPNQAIRYSFLDERFAKTWTNETLRRTQTIFSAFAGLAIFIACLGLFALATFTMEQRSKEISIRKVLGASLSSLFSLVTSHFFKLVLLSLILAIPLGWWLMNLFLEDFAYRIDISWEAFAITGIAAFLIVLFTVSKQAISLATSNPVKSLKDE